MTGPAAADLRAAAGASQELLASVPDFSAHVPSMDGDVRRVVQHIAECLQWYAHDLVAGPTEALGPTPTWPEDGSPADLVATTLARLFPDAPADDDPWMRPR